MRSQTFLIRVVAFVCFAALTAACLPSSFAGGGGGKREASKNRDEASPRPTEGDESLPGYFLNVTTVAADGDATTGLVRVTAPAGSLSGKSGARVGIMRVPQAAMQNLAPYAADGSIGSEYIVIAATQLASVVVQKDGSFSADAAFGVVNGDVLLVTSDLHEGGRVVLRDTAHATAGYRDPFGSGALRTLLFRDVVAYPDRINDEDGPVSDPDDFVDASDSGEPVMPPAGGTTDVR